MRHCWRGGREVEVLCVCMRVYVKKWVEGSSLYTDESTSFKIRNYVTPILTLSATYFKFSWKTNGLQQLEVKCKTAHCLSFWKVLLQPCSMPLINGYRELRPAEYCYHRIVKVVFVSRPWLMTVMYIISRGTHVRWDPLTVPKSVTLVPPFCHFTALTACSGY